VILGRDAATLEESKRTILETRMDKTSAPASVRVCQADLQDMSTLARVSEDLFSDDLTMYSKAIFVNNAGLIWPVGAIGRSMSPADRLREMSDAVNLNVTAANFLTEEIVSRHLRLIDDNHSDVSAAGTEFSTKLVIVNISSVCANVPFVDLSAYCTGKAARDMFHRCVAEEQKGKSSSNLIRVLNWAPGPMETNMTAEIRSITASPLKSIFDEMASTGKMVPLQDSADKLVKLLLWEAYESGSHVDFFDPYPADFNPSQPTNCCACSQCTCGVDCACKTAQKRLCEGCEEALKCCK
jgi:sepiapterin reductase